MSETSAIANAATIGYIIQGILAVLTIIAWWKIFKKAGQPGWKSIIPLYDGHVLYGICWRPLYFWLTALFVGGSEVIYELCIKEQAQPSIVLSLLAIAMGVVGIVFIVKFCLKLARSFGKSVGFAIGLILLNTIFILILGFGKAEYVGNMGVKKEECAAE